MPPAILTTEVPRPLSWIAKCTIGSKREWLAADPRPRRLWSNRTLFTGWENVEDGLLRHRTALCPEPHARLLLTRTRAVSRRLYSRAYRDRAQHMTSESR